MIKTAVVLTHNRPELLERCVAAIGPQVDAVLIIDNASDPPTKFDIPDGAFPLVNTMHVPDQPPNIPRMWTYGMDWAGKYAARFSGEHAQHAAFLCDDAIVPPGWFDAVSEAMWLEGAAAGCSDPFGRLWGERRVKRQQDNDISGRMIGWAFILNLGAGIVPDESMAFWWCDTDIDWQARERGGFVMTGGPELIVPNELPNGHLVARPDLQQQAGDDGLAFAAKYSGRPW